MKRPELSKNITPDLFEQFYYLKEELICFCKENYLPTTGSKTQLNKRIIYFLKTGQVLTKAQVKVSKTASIQNICENTLIEENFVCSQAHRAFFEQKIGKKFTFNVAFQKWLKNNSGKSYKEALTAYNELLLQKKTTKTTIDQQFEYNTYIRDFFEANKNKTLKEAIKCWNYKKSQMGHNRFEEADLKVLENNN